MPFDNSQSLYPIFEITRTLCTCGKELPLYAYDENFYNYLKEFIEKNNLNEESRKNLMVKPNIDNLLLCCKCCCVYGKTFPISVENAEKDTANETKKQITALPSPISENDYLAWVS